MISNLDDVWHASLGVADQQDSALTRKRRLYRIKMVGAVGVSYAIDCVLLILFAAAGTVALSVPAIYGLAATVHVLLFGALHWRGWSERANNTQLVLWQMAYAISLQLLCMVLAPNLTTFFLAIIVITFAFGALRLSLGQALVMWLAVCLAIGGVLLAFRGRHLVLPQPSDFEVVLVGLAFGSVLLRCLLLGYYASLMRVRLFQDNLQLAEHIAERHRVEAELARHQQHLERMVEDRTLALSAAKEAAEAANRTKSTFLANMSHELRTPLNGILGLTVLARRRATDPKQIEQLDKVGAVGKQLLGIINAILDMSKIEADSLSLERTGFKVATVLENLRTLLVAEAAAKNLELTVLGDPRVLEAQVYGDPFRLSQVLLDLTGNAVKFTEQGVVTVSVQSVQEDSESLVVQFQIRDTGIGMSAEVMQRLFRPFEQADSSMTRRYGGAGLGLAISKHLVEMMGGRIGVDSEPGRGSSFWFTVRLAKEPAPEADVPTQPSAPENLH